MKNAIKYKSNSVLPLGKWNKLKNYSLVHWNMWISYKTIFIVLESRNSLNFIFLWHYLIDKSHTINKVWARLVLISLTALYKYNSFGPPIIQLDFCLPKGTKYVPNMQIAFNFKLIKPGFCTPCNHCTNDLYDAI